MADQHIAAGATVVIVDPAAEIEVRRNPIAPRLKSLCGARIAIIDNTKHMANRFLDAIRVRLEARYEAGGFEYYRKFSASVPTPPEVIERLIKSCDAVIHGVAD